MHAYDLVKQQLRGSDCLVLADTLCLRLALVLEEGDLWQNYTCAMQGGGSALDFELVQRISMPTPIQHDSTSCGLRLMAGIALTLNYMPCSMACMKSTGDPLLRQLTCD
jgi:hypothetical protein